MTNNRLKALVTLSILRLPQFDGSVGTCRNKHVKAVDLGVDEFSNFAFMGLR